MTLALCQLWKRDGGQTGKQEREGSHSEITEAPKSASLSGLFMCLQGDREAGAKQYLHTERHNGPRIESMRQTETDTVLTLFLKAT